MTDLPRWEALYEPGNVSSYLIGYLNDEAPAKAAAEAWLRSWSEVIGELRWDEFRLDADRLIPSRAFVSSTAPTNPGRRPDGPRLEL
jgi:hypothetical protein